VWRHDVACVPALSAKSVLRTRDLPQAVCRLPFILPLSSLSRATYLREYTHRQAPLFFVRVLESGVRSCFTLQLAVELRSLEAL
jgi:hypothetical protein